VQWDKEAIEHNFQAQAKWDEDARDPAEKGPKPSASPPAKATIENVASTHAALMREHVGKLAQWTEKARAYKAAYKWIQETVDPSVYQGAVRECENEQARMEKEQLTEMIDGDPQSKSWTLQLLLRILKRDYAPSETSARTLAQSTYRKKLAVVKAGRVNPKEWLQEWRAAYQDALLYDLPDVKGPLAVLDFIKAVQEKLAPE
jgi:hypothetical protein